MHGIHAVLTRPTERHIAVWDPTNVTQSAIVLGWLAEHLGERLTQCEVGTGGGLYLHFTTGHVIYVPANDVLVIHPVCGSVEVYTVDEVEDVFAYDRPILDLDQPELFDIRALIDAI